MQFRKLPCLVGVGRTDTELSRGFTYTDKLLVDMEMVSDAGEPFIFISHFLEPAILVMHHSMKPHPAITATLLDFMCRVSTKSLFAQS